MVLGLYYLVLIGFNAFYSHHFFAVGYLGHRAALWSLFFIPLLTLAVHTVLLALARPWLLGTVLALDSLADLALATHWAYFGLAPTLTSVLLMPEEASAGVRQAWNFIPHGLAAFLILRFFVLILLAAFVRKKVLKCTAAWIVVAAALSLAMAFLGRSPRDAASVNAYEVCTKIHGFYTAAIAERVFRHTATPQHAPESSSPTLEIPRENLAVSPDYCQSILAIQVESLDWEVLTYESKGVPATPFLQTCARNALLLKLDFQFLTRQLPPRFESAYRQEGMVQLPSLPRMLRAQGYSTVAMHGNASSFWNRSKGFKQLGVDLFMDRLAYPALDGGWGVSDRTFLETNLRVIQATQRPTLFFMITLSSHAPFTWVQHQVFPGRGVEVDYLNAIHYTDQCMEQFIKGLPGRHLVVLYGDHASNVYGPRYNSRPHGKEYVPGMVFLKDASGIHAPWKPGGHQATPPGNFDIRSLGALVATLVSPPPPPPTENPGA